MVEDLRRVCGLGFGAGGLGAWSSGLGLGESPFFRRPVGAFPR